MMLATLTLTPTSNVDEAQHRLIDYTKVSRQTYKWTDCITVYDIHTRRNEEINVDRVSLYHHRLVLGGTQYYIVHMQSKPEKVETPEVANYP